VPGVFVLDGLAAIVVRALARLWDEEVMRVSQASGMKPLSPCSFRLTA
jgi:hypothetical protein